MFIGQRGSIEERLAVQAGLQFVAVPGGKFRRVPGSSIIRQLLDVKNTALNLRDMLRIGAGVVKSRRVIKQFKPDVIFNKAGTTGIPVGIAANQLKVPMVIHEPDAAPGLANRILSRWATFVAVGFPAEAYSGTVFPAQKLKFTGTPIQQTIVNGKAAAARKRYGLENKLPLVLVVGGSQGGMALNTAVLSILKDLTAKAQVVHATGPYDFQRVNRRAEELELKSHNRYKVFDFLNYEELADLYAAADIVVARAGANTIAELAALKRTVVLVPNQEAAAHQLLNARRIGEAGGAIVVSDREPEALFAALSRLLGSDTEKKKLAANLAESFAKPKAAAELADLIILASGLEDTNGRTWQKGSA